jgi:hypothetical protein
MAELWVATGFVRPYPWMAARRHPIRVARTTTVSHMKLDRERFTVRLPPELKAWLDAQATKNQRSSNGEIITLLKAARRQARAECDEAAA